MELSKQIVSLEQAKKLKELGEMLPKEIELPDNPEYWDLGAATFIQNKRFVMYGKYGIKVVPDALCFDIENTEADARAKCLIYLIENGLIKA